MTRRVFSSEIALTMVLLSACGKKEETVKVPEPVAVASAPEARKLGAPDFGATAKISREVEAVGSTLDLAVLSALQSAVAQVNGVRVASRLQSLRAGLDVTVDGQNAGSVRAEAFAQKMIANSQGLVLAYEVIKQEEIDKVDEETTSKVRASDGGFSYSASSSSEGSYGASASANGTAKAGDANASYSGSVARFSDSKEKLSVEAKKGSSSYSSDVTNRKMRSYWKVRLRAEIAQYRVPEEDGRPKIVVALPKTLVQNYPVGDGKVVADEVARAVRGRLSDILTKTKRFIVLDREFDADMQSEIDRINSGNVRAQDTARLGQQMATNLILIPTIERFEYPKEVKKLRMSDRELVSYSGGGRITLRLLNATTGEVVMSDSFEHKLSPADPSTMPRIIDGNSMASELMDQLSGKIGSAIVAEVFPVSVISLTGEQVVLSQGGESLKVGQRWQAVYLGEELRDPQTGRSLGRNEMPVGTIRIDRVSSQTSYGTLENGSANLGNKPFTSGSIGLRKQVVNSFTKADESEKSVNPSEDVKQASGKQTGIANKSSKLVREVAGVEPPAIATKQDASKDSKW